MHNWAGPVRFESHDAAQVVTFSQRMGEWESTQELQVGIESIHGAHYGHDPWGRAPAPVSPAEERWRALVPNEDVDEVRSTLHRIGKGRLYIQLHDGSERWAWARLNAMPDISLGIRGVPYAPISMPFTRLSDWYEAEATTVTETISTDPTTVNVTNAGTVDSRNIVVQLQELINGGISHPTIRNDTTAEQFTIDLFITVGVIYRVDVLNFRLEESTDGGSTWDDLTQALILGDTQVSPLSLAPGGNVITIQGGTDASLELTFYSAWR